MTSHWGISADKALRQWNSQVVLACIHRNKALHPHSHIIRKSASFIPNWLPIHLQVTLCSSILKPEVFLSEIRWRSTQTLLLFLLRFETLALKLKYFTGFQWPNISSLTLIFLILEMEFENRLNNFRTFVTMVTQDGAGEISSLYILILRYLPLCPCLLQKLTVW